MMRFLLISCFMFVKVSYNRQLQVKLGLDLSLTQALAIPSGFGSSRIRRNCGYKWLCTVFIPIFHLIPSSKINFKQ